VQESFIGKRQDVAETCAFTVDGKVHTVTGLQLLSAIDKC